MTAYGKQRAEKRPKARRRRGSAPPAASLPLRAKEEERKCQRRRQRWQRRQEEGPWRKRKAQQRRDAQVRRGLSPAQKRPEAAGLRERKSRWTKERQQRRRLWEERRPQEETWRAARAALRAEIAPRTSGPPSVSAVVVWFAILVVVDNGTRRCLGLPLFEAGVHVTAARGVAALCPLLPPTVRFLISDNGSPFTTEAFQELSNVAPFPHGRIAPHRPCTNGIAERFVRTLKEGLAEQTWASAEQLAQLLAAFEAYYNERPHQGRELDGLSPNEYARRLSSRAAS